jgi:hypothetical protein
LEDDSYAIDAGLLRPGDERRGKQAASDHADERPPVHYSIT